MPRRKSDRSLAYLLNAKIEFNGNHIHGYLTDISETGFSININENVDHKKIKLIIKMPEPMEKDDLILNAEKIWFEENINNIPIPTHYAMGCQFINITSDEMSNIIKLLDYITIINRHIKY